MPEPQKIAKTKSHLMYCVELLGGVSVLISLISLALPWWGIEMTPFSFSWGVLAGPAQLTPVFFFTDRLDQMFSTNYVFIQSLVAVTAVLVVVGTLLKRWPILAAALISSTVTDLSFTAEIEDAVAHNCDRTLLNGPSCISGLVGQGTSGIYYVTWGFKSGFYAYVASGLLILAALALLQWNKSRGEIHPPSANVDFRPKV